VRRIIRLIAAIFFRHERWAFQRAQLNSDNPMARGFYFLTLFPWPFSILPMIWYFLLLVNAIFDREVAMFLSMVFQVMCVFAFIVLVIPWLFSWRPFISPFYKSTGEQARAKLSALDKKIARFSYD
jgi:hypothetical protein